MTNAFKRYVRAISEVQKDEKEGNLPELPVGGSTHGSTELTYRIHATRLKVLLASIRDQGGNSSKRQGEALRLVSMYWETPPVAFDFEEGTRNNSFQLQESRWEVLVDIVFGLASCREKKHYFHRSVFRHAQAILWAPFVYHGGKNAFDVTKEKGSGEKDLSILSNEYRNTVYLGRASRVISQICDKKRYGKLRVQLSQKICLCH
jgi:hypothetical protein